MKRTEYCGKFGEQHRGTRQQAAGWVQNKRDMGGVIFLDLKDREGVLQVVCDASELGGGGLRAGRGGAAPERGRGGGRRPPPERGDL